LKNNTDSNSLLLMVLIATRGVGEKMTQFRASITVSNINLFFEITSITN